MIDLTDLKIIASGAAGNIALAFVDLAAAESIVKITGHIVLCAASVYYMYQNHKRK